MNRLLAFLFLQVFLWTQIGVYIEFMYVGANFSAKFEEGLRKEDSLEKQVLILSEVSYNQLIWLGKNEFSYEGKLYDVISTERKSNSYCLQVHSDEKEEKWLTAWFDFMEQSESEDEDECSFVLPFLKVPMKSEVYTWNLDFCSIPLPQHVVPYSKTLKSICLESNSPPPEA